MQLKSYRRPLALLLSLAMIFSTGTANAFAMGNNGRPGYRFLDTGAGTIIICPCPPGEGDAPMVHEKTCSLYTPTTQDLVEALMEKIDALPDPATVGANPTDEQRAAFDGVMEEYLALLEADPSIDAVLGSLRTEKLAALSALLNTATMGLEPTKQITQSLNFTVSTHPADCSAISGHTHAGEKCFTWSDSTLILNNLDLAVPVDISGNVTGITLPANATVVVNGENTVTTSDGRDHLEGIYAEDTSTDTLTFTGNGSLTVTVGNSTSNQSWGLVSSGHVEIKDACTLSFTAGNAQGSSKGLSANSLIFSTTDTECTLTAKSGKADRGDSYGLELASDSTPFTVPTGVTVTAVGGNTTGGSSCGVYTNDRSAIIVDGGTLSATAGNSGWRDSYGVSATAITVNAGTFEAKCGTASASATARAVSVEPNYSAYTTAQVSATDTQGGTLASVDQTTFNDNWDSYKHLKIAAPAIEPTKQITRPLFFTYDPPADCSAITGHIKHPDGAYCFAWSDGTRTLTLNNLDLAVPGSTTGGATGITLPANATVVVKGTNTITVGDSSYYVQGISASGASTDALTFTGKGSLTVTAGNSTVDSSCGLKLSGTVEIDDACTLSFTAGNVGRVNSYGVSATAITVNAGTFEVKCGTTGAIAQAVSVKPDYSAYTTAQVSATDTQGGTLAPVTQDDFTRDWKSYKHLKIAAPAIEPTKQITQPLFFTADGGNTPPANCEALSGHIDHPDGAYCFAWSDGTLTLTLNNLDLAAPGSTTGYPTGIKLPANATVVVKGENTVTAGDSDSIVQGIYAANGETDTLTFTGEGSLTVTAGNSAGNHSYGLKLSGTVEIDDACTLSFTGGDASASSKGLSADSLIISAACTLTAKSGNADTGNSYGLELTSGSLFTVPTGVTVTAISGNATRNSSRGVRTGSAIIVDGGTLTATAGAAGSDSYGVSATAITVNAGTFEAKCSTAGAGGTAQAVSVEPDYSAYTTAQASATGAVGGTLASVTQDEFGNNWDSYKHLKIAAPATEPTKQITQPLDFTVPTPLANCEALSGHIDHPDGAYCFTWSDGTLTLNNLDLAAPGSTTTGATGIKLPANATVVVNGTNTIAVSDSSYHVYGISVSGTQTDALTFTGAGSLTVTVGKSAGGVSYGLYFLNGAVDVTSPCTLSFTSGDVVGTGISKGLSVGSLTLAPNCTLTAKSGSAENLMSCGLQINYGDTLTIPKGATVTAIGGECTGTGFTNGFSTNGSLTLAGGTLTAKSGNAGSDCSGMYVGGVFKVEDGTLTATGGESATGKSRGIYAGASFTLSGGTTTAQAAVGGTPFKEAPTLTGGVAHKTGTGSWDNTQGLACTYHVPSTGDGDGDYDDSPAPSIPPTLAQPGLPTAGQVQVTAQVDAGGNGVITLTNQNILDAYSIAYAAAAERGSLGNGITLFLTVDTGSKSLTSATVNLPKAAQETILAKQILSTVVVINNPNITLSIDLPAIREMNRQAGADLTLTATPRSLKALGAHPLFALTATYGNGKQVTDLGDGRITIALPYTPTGAEKPGNLQGVRVDANGAVFWLQNSTYDSVKKTLFLTAHTLSSYGVGHRQDVSAYTDGLTHWAAEDIAFVASRDLLTGTTATTFAPDAPITKGDLATALGKMAGVDVTTFKESSYTDVPTGAKNFGYLQWAGKNKIIPTTGDTFQPDASLTREQLAQVLVNFANYTGFALPKAHGELLFADAAKISAPAKPAVKQLQMAGVLAPKSQNLLDPQGVATRAQTAATLHRYIALLVSPDTTTGWSKNDSGQWMYYENGKPLTGQKEMGGTTHTFDPYGVVTDLPKSQRYGTYTIQDGDSYWRIAQKLRCTISELEALNKKGRYDPIYTGDVISVPAN